MSRYGTRSLTSTSARKLFLSLCEGALEEGYGSMRDPSFLASRYDAYDEARKLALLGTLLEQLQDEDPHELTPEVLYVLRRNTRSFCELPRQKQAHLLLKAEFIEFERRIADSASRRAVYTERLGREDTSRNQREDDRRQAALVQAKLRQQADAERRRQADAERRRRQADAERRHRQRPFRGDRSNSRNRSSSEGSWSSEEDESPYARGGHRGSTESRHRKRKRRH